MKTLTNSRSESARSALMLAAVAGLAVAVSSQGAVITWTNTAANNKFDDKLNWNPNAAVPGVADEAVIALANAAATISAGNVTLDKLTLNGLASTALIVDGKNLTTKTTSAITKGELRLNAKTGGNVLYTAEANGIAVGNGGIIIMDAPATAGDVTIRLPGILQKFKVNAGGELRVKPGAGLGGGRTIDGDFENAGKLTVDKSLTIKYTLPGGGPGDVLVKNSGTVSVANNQSLNVVGNDLDVSNFTMSGGKITNGGNILLEKLTFNYDGGTVRNGADADRGGVNLKAGVWNLNQNAAIFLQVIGGGSIAGTGIKAAQQEVYWDAAGGNADMSFVVAPNGPGPNALRIFENKGKMTFATGGNILTFSGLGAKNVVLNSGTMQSTGNGAVVIDKARFTNSPAGTFNISADLRLRTPAAEPAAEVPINAGKMIFTRNGATLNTDRTLQNFSNAGRGLISVSGGGIKATIETPGGKVKGGTVDVKNITQAAPPAPIGGAAAFTITEALRSTGSSGSAATFTQATLTFVGGYDQEPDSIFETAIFGLSPSTFEVGTIDCIGGLTLGGTMNLFLAGFEPSVGQSFAVARSDSFIVNTFDFGGGVSDLVYPIGGSGSLQFRVAYNVPDTTIPGSYLVTLTAEAVPTPGTVTLLTLAGLTAAPRRRRNA